MILSDGTLILDTFYNRIEVRPHDSEQVQPASIDIRLGDSFCVPVLLNTEEIVTFDTPLTYKRITSDQFILKPKEFVLATTKEYIKLPSDVSAFVEGRSSIGRIGLFIQNAGWVDPGFEGEITLELFNASNNPILLTAGRRVGQLVFAKLDYPAMRPYNGKYQGQTGATGSKIHEDLKSGK